MRKTPRSEMTLAAAVVSWLQGQHWEVYQEVSCLGSVCDIVAVQGPRLWAIECKVSMGLAVLGQGLYWLGQGVSNHVSVATGYVGERGAALMIAAKFGLGVLTVPGEAVQVLANPSLQRRTAPSLRKALREEQKTYAPAGGNRYWTPFQATCKAVRDYLAMRRNQGAEVTMRELVDGIHHHYASAASARNHLARWIETGKVEGVAVRRDGRRLLVEEASP